MNTYSTVSFFEFQERFQTENACFRHLQEFRWSDGFKCPLCGHTQAYFMEKRKVFQCANCRIQTSLTAHTIFHKTHTSLKKWFWAVFLVGSDKRGCSAQRLSKLIGVSYPTAWLMIHKIRNAMKNRDTRYKLQQLIKEIVKPSEAMDKLPWVHTLIGNAKSFIRGTYHGVSHKHLQNYLSEF